MVNSLTVNVSAPLKSEKLQKIVSVCPSLKILRAMMSTIVDKDIQTISKLQQLRVLNLNWCYKFSNIQYIFTLPNLTSLSLNDCKLTDSDFKGIGQLSSLTHLSLGWCNVADETAMEISSLHNLTYLDMSATWITDQGMSHISKLTLLDVSSCGITILGVKHISCVPNLQFLAIQECLCDKAETEETILNSFPNLISLCALNMDNHLTENKLWEEFPTS